MSPSAYPSVGRLLAATRETDDWSPWLVLADALLERDDVRGTLIQVQHRISETTDPEERGRLGAWLLATQERHRDAWAAEILPPDFPSGDVSPGWDRGFVAQVFVRRVADDVRSVLDALVAHPLGQGLNHVRLIPREPVPHQALDAFLASSFAPRVRSWSFSRPALGPGHSAVIAKRLPHVRTLDLRADALGDEGLLSLARAPFPNLTSLHINGADDTRPEATAGLAALFAAPWPLRTLVLVSAHLGEREAEALARSTYARQLKGLELMNCRLGPWGARALLGAPFPTLERLGLAWNDLRDAGVRALTPEVLPALVRTSLQGNGIGLAGAHWLANRPWPAGAWADVSNNPLGEAGQAVLRDAPLDVRLVH